MAGSSQAVIDRRKLDALRAREDARFAERTPRSAALARRAGKHLPGGVPMAWMKGLFRTPPIYVTHGEGARFFDVDGNGYLDFNVADLAMTMGFGPKPIADAVARQIAEGAHFLLPGEAAVEVAEELARRVGLPAWQFTLSASAANVEVIRIARFVTGRQKIVVFEGHYHGHIEETLVHRDESGGSRPDLLGLAPGAARHTVVVPFNDLEALEAVLEGGEVALVVTEPALTNCNLVLPDAGFLAGLRALTQAHGALLCYDEAHTFQFAYGGLVKAWALESDFVVLGKGLGSGVSFALYGMTAPVAEVFERHIDVDIGPAGIATGGTTYGSALAVAAAKAALTEVLTPEGYDHVTRLGAALAEGLRGIFAKHDLPWTAFELGPRSGFCLAPALPRSYAEAALSLDAALIDARRVFMANRGIWDAVASAGPQASFAHTDRDIAAYLETADAFITAVV